MKNERISSALRWVPSVIFEKSLFSRNQVLHTVVLVGEADALSCLLSPESHDTIPGVYPKERESTNIPFKLQDIEN